MVALLNALLLLVFQLASLVILTLSPSPNLKARLFQELVAKGPAAAELKLRSKFFSPVS